MSAPNLGDFAEDATLHHIWSTNDRTGTSVTRATDGTISVYKDNGVTQSVAGITDTENFDGLTGIHALTIDLSADAFYATGANYTVVLSGAVIDGKAVNAVLAHFSIENRVVDVAAIDGNKPAAVNLAASAEVIETATVDTVTNGHTPTTTEFQCDDITDPNADHYNGRVVLFRSGDLIRSGAIIEDYVIVGGIAQFTVSAMPVAPANNDTLVIV